MASLLGFKELCQFKSVIKMKHSTYFLCWGFAVSARHWSRMIPSLLEIFKNWDLAVRRRRLRSEIFACLRKVKHLFWNKAHDKDSLRCYLANVTYLLKIKFDLNIKRFNVETLQSDIYNLGHNAFDQREVTATTNVRYIPFTPPCL